MVKQLDKKLSNVDTSKSHFRREFGGNSDLDPLVLAADLLDPGEDPYYNHPRRWIMDMFDWRKVGKRPTVYQLEMVDDLVSGDRLAVRGPHALGKTAWASWVVLWFAITREKAMRDWKVITTASNWRQLEKYLWPEIHKWSRLILWEKLGRDPFNSNTELLTLTLKLNYGQASAVASDDPAAIEGAHADSLLYILDEAKTIPTPTWEAVEGAFSGAGTDTGNEAFCAAISTPGVPSGVFYEIHSRKQGKLDWKARHVTLDEAIAAKRISRQWAENRKKDWGGESAVYQNRVLGEFAADAVDSVIPLSWAEKAMSRSFPSTMVLGASAIAADIARSGVDRNAIAVVSGLTCLPIRAFHSGDTMHVTGEIVNTVRESEGEKRPKIVVDVVGLGAGVVDRLREMGFEVDAFNGAASPMGVTDASGELKFLNRRAAAWWHMRELLDPAKGNDVSLPDDEELLGDLCTPKYKRTSRGQIQVEEKEEIKKRLGHSPDKGDAVVMAFDARESGSSIITVLDGSGTQARLGGERGWHRWM